MSSPTMEEEENDDSVIEILSIDDTHDANSSIDDMIDPAYRSYLEQFVFNNYDIDYDGDDLVPPPPATQLPPRSMPNATQLYLESIVDDDDDVMIDPDYLSFLQQLINNDDFDRDDLVATTPPALATRLSLVEVVEFRNEGFVVVCAICTDELVEGMMVNRLPCSHHYHGHCILPWLRIRNTCPLCRFQLL